MAAFDKEAGFVATKQYTYVKGKLCFLVTLFSATTGELLALIEADYLGRLRTGAASGVATNISPVRTPAPPPSSARVARQKLSSKPLPPSAKSPPRVPMAATRSAGPSSVKRCPPVYRSPSLPRTLPRKLLMVWTSSPPLPHPRGPFSSQTISRQASTSTPSAPITLTNRNSTLLPSPKPISSSWIPSNSRSKRRATSLSRSQQQPACWNDVHELAQLVAGQVPGRTSDSQITLFKSNGIAAWDLAVAVKVYHLAKEKGFGRDLPFYSSIPA